ncbi:hypothetical protein [Yinghuangia soli]|uniref:Uncharacterized protein n=1 Tax=Yinghuangia soli TaxID=2908204 RepID=A0AA41PWR1_9ACTN|nr:hypothetical protein [Yinghuangia soli]MCF2527133.1 hypothetical protein [Yinghuangia soli]
MIRPIRNVGDEVLNLPRDQIKPGGQGFHTRPLVILVLKDTFSVASAAWINVDKQKGEQ